MKLGLEAKTVLVTGECRTRERLDVTARGSRERRRRE